MEKTCRKCGSLLPETSFKMTRWGKRSDVCNKCASTLCAETKARQKAKKESAVRNLRLADFTPRELMNELYRRGYEGTLTYTRVERIDITKLD